MAKDSELTVPGQRQVVQAAGVRGRNVQDLPIRILQPGDSLLVRGVPVATPPTPPTPPQPGASAPPIVNNVRVTNATGGFVVAWDGIPAPAAAEYEIDYGPHDGSNRKSLRVSGSARSVTVTATGRGYAGVSAIRDALKSSEPAYKPYDIPTGGTQPPPVLGTPPAGAPLAIGPLSIDEITATGVGVNWTEREDGMRYAVRVWQSGGSWEAAAATEVFENGDGAGAGTGADFANLTPGKQYSAGVQPIRVSDGVRGPVSPIATFTTLAAGTPVPGPQPQPGGGGSAVVPYYEKDWPATLAVGGDVEHIYGAHSIQTGTLIDGSTGRYFKSGPRPATTPTNLEPQLGVNLNPPNALIVRPREIWLDTSLRFSGGGWANARDDKTLFVLPDYSFAGGAAEIHRWDIYLRGEWTFYGGPYPQGGVPDWILFDQSPKAVFDGQWHRLRLHYKMASNETATDGAYEVWIDNTLVCSRVGIRTANPAAAFFRMIALGRNSYSSEGASRDWGKLKVYTSKPAGW